VIPEAEPWVLVVLAVVGLVAGAVNTVAGAGSLLLLPALVFSGLPDDAANATNRIGILAQTAMAVWGYRRAGIQVGKAEAGLSGVVMVGGAVGSFVATLLSAGSMRIAILVAMGTMLVLSLVPAKKKAPGEKPAPRKPVPVTPLVVVGLGLCGVYGGFLQAGVGILVLLFLTHTTETDLVTANVLKSTATLGLTLVALVVFGAAGETLDPARGVALALGSGVGGAVGARATVALGERFVRYAVVVAVSAAMAKLVFDML
jgi:uncharacterized protein